MKSIFRPAHEERLLCYNGEVIGWYTALSFVESPIEKRGGTYAQINILEYRFPERCAHFRNAQSADVQRRTKHTAK